MTSARSRILLAQNQNRKSNQDSKIHLKLSNSLNKLFNDGKDLMANFESNLKITIDARNSCQKEKKSLKKTQYQRIYSIQRSLTKVKQNNFLKQSQNKLEQAINKGWMCLKNQQRIQLFSHLQNSLKILKSRFCFDDKFQNQKELIMNIEKNLISIKNEKYFQISKYAPIYFQYASNKNSQQNIKKVNYQGFISQNFDETRPSTANLHSNSSKFMNNYVTLLKNKAKDRPKTGYSKKYHSQYEQKTNFLRCKTAKINRKSLKEKQIIIYFQKQYQNQHKSQKVIRDNKNHTTYSTKMVQTQEKVVEIPNEKKSIIKKSKINIKPNTNQEGFLESTISKKVSHLKTSNVKSGKAQSKSFNDSNSFEQILAKQVNSKRKSMFHQQKQKAKVFHKSHDRKQKQENRIHQNQNKSQKNRFVKFEKQQKNSLQKVFDQNNFKKKTRKGKLRKVNIKARRKTINQNIKSKRQSDFGSNEILNNQQQKSFPSSHSNSCSSFDENNIYPSESQNTFKTFQTFEHLPPRPRVPGNHHLKRNAVLCQSINLHSKRAQTKVSSDLSNMQSTKKIAVFAEMNQLNKQIYDHLQSNHQDVESAMFREQQHLKKLDDNRNRVLYGKKQIIRSQNRHAFDMECTEFSKRIFKIKQFQRFYSFAADQQWIKCRWNKNQDQITQKCIQIDI